MIHQGSIRRREAIEGYLCILPWLLGFVVFVGGPIIGAMGISLTNWNLLAAPRYIGIDNYMQLAKDPLFWQALKVTLIYTAFHIPLAISLGFAVALMLNQDVKPIALWRTIYYLPAVVSGVAVAMLWMWVFNPELGLANRFLALFGVEGVGWLRSSHWALPALIIMSLWNIGGGMVIYLAGLQGIPTELYEAAKIDGAGAWRRFSSVTIPLMTPVLFFQVIIGIIGSLQVFTNAFVMTQGGPANATLFYVLYLYYNAFQNFKMGYAAALAWILFLLILALTIVVVWSSNRWVYYEAEGRSE